MQFPFVFSLEIKKLRKFWKNEKSLRPIIQTGQYHSLEKKKEKISVSKKVSKRSIFHAICLCVLFHNEKRWKKDAIADSLKNDLSVRDDRRGSLHLLFSLFLRNKRNFFLPLSETKRKINVLVKTIVKYIYPTTPDTLSTKRQGRQTQIQRHTPFNVHFDVDKFNASGQPRQRGWALMQRRTSSLR